MVSSPSTSACATSMSISDGNARFKLDAFDGAPSLCDASRESFSGLPGGLVGECVLGSGGVDAPLAFRSGVSAPEWVAEPVREESPSWVLAPEPPARLFYFRGKKFERSFSS